MGVGLGEVSENVALKRVYAVQGRREEDRCGLQSRLLEGKEKISWVCTLLSLSLVGW